MASPGPSNPSPDRTQSLPEALWSLTIPLIITHPSHPNNPFITTIPRFSYLAFLLPRLTTFFPSTTPISSFHFEDIQLRNLAVGLLVDLYRPPLPWRLTVSDGPEWDIGDTFMNSAKEADFVRNGNAKQIMSLSKDDTTALWNAVQDSDLPSYLKIQSLLLNTSTPLKNVPLRIYLPTSPSGDLAPGVSSPSSSSSGRPVPGSFKVVQSLVSPRLENRQQNTLGTALNSILPTVFPSRRDPVLANVILHGAPVPLDAPLEDLMRDAAYPDGWLCLIVVPFDV